MENICRKIIFVKNAHCDLSTDGLKKHYEVYSAQSADELFDILERITPDLIVLDIHMLQDDGYDALKRRKADARFANIPVICLTSQNDKESVIRGMNLGAADFMTKPYSDSELIAHIEDQFDSEKTNANKPIILAVDDSPSILKSVNYLLNTQYKVYTLSEPEKIYELLERITPDLFLLDCNMPGLNGFELVPILRKMPHHAETPIVFLTSEGTLDNLTTAIHLGACDFTIKPINEEMLQEKIAMHLADFMMRRRIRSLL